MGWFDAIGGIDPAGNSPRFPDGTFIARVHELKVNQGQWGLRFIAEMDVISSSVPEVPEGSRRSWTVQIDGAYAKIGMGEVKTFCGVAQGLDPSDKDSINQHVTSTAMESAVSPAQPFRGRLIKMQVNTKTTNTGHNIAKHQWMVVDAAEAASLGVSVPATPPAPVAAPMPPGVPMAAPPAYTPPAPAAAAPPPYVPPAAPAPMAPPPVAFPPTGWTAHPTSAGWWYRGQECLNEAQLRERAARGAV